MKRPFACVGFSVLFSLVLAISFGYTVALYMVAVCFVLSSVLFIIYFAAKKKTVSAAVCALSACFAFGIYTLMMTLYVYPIIEQYSGKNVDVTATVTSNPYSENGNTYFNVKTSQINGENKKLNIQIITNYVQPVKCYDTVRIKAELYSDYETGIGYSSYCGARNIFLKAYVNPYYKSVYEIISSDNKPFYAVFQTFRNTFLQTFQKYLPHDLAGVCTAVITGDKTFLPDDIYRNFKNLGVSHLLVVSGLHLSILAGAVYSFTSKVIKNRYVSSAFQILCVLLFAAFTGFGFSVIRASVMIIVLILGRMLNSRSDALNSLGLASLILCLFPLNAGDIGLLWSFVTTLSLILFSNSINESINEKLDIESKTGKKIVSLFSTATAAFIGSLPFVIFVTGNISPYTVLVNVLTVPFTGIIIICGGISVVMFMINLNVFAYPLMYICGLVTKYVVYTVNLFSGFPNAAVSTQKTAVYVWFAVCIAMGALLFFFDKKKVYTRLGVCAMAVALIAVYSVDFIVNSEKVVLSVLDIGDGLTVTLKKNDSIIVINSYGEKYQFSTVRNELSEYEHIDCMIDMPSGDYSYNYCGKIISQFNVNNVLLYDSEKASIEYSYARYKGVNTIQIADDYTYNLYDGVQFRFIAVDNKVWCRCIIYGKELLICPQEANTEHLPKEFFTPDIVILSDIPKNCDILKDPYIVVSGYGDEADEYLDYLQSVSDAVAVTNGLGRIDFTFKQDGSVSVSREYTGGVKRWQ